MTLDRRTMIDGLGALAALAPLLAGPAAAQSPDAHTQISRIDGLKMTGREQVVMLLYPDFTALDLVGPHFFFAGMMGAKVHLVSTQPDLAPVRSDLGLAIQPTVTMDEAPKAPTILFVPGGTRGTLAAAGDPEVLAFVQACAARAEYVTSVCTGALVLGAAGLLRGKRATTHWAAMEALPHFGATPVDARVVEDGRVITGAGVSAGLDFALSVVARLRGQPYAQALMLQAEYAPQPPFPGGDLKSTDPQIAALMTRMLGDFPAQARKLKVAP